MIPLERFLARCAVAFALVVCPLAAGAQSREIVSTRCHEIEIALDDQHTSSLLGPCGDDASENLLWHLDRIDQISGGLDGHFTRRNRGAGVSVYVMDTGVLASHDEFARDGGRSAVVAGYDVSGVVPLGASDCSSVNKALQPCYADTTELVAASHGTSVASLIAGQQIGVAPGASIISVRVMNERGLAVTRSYLDGLDAIIRHAWSQDGGNLRTSIVNISGWVLDRLTNASSESATAVSYSDVEKKMAAMIDGVDAHGHRDPAGKKFLFVVAANNLDGGCGRAGNVDRFPATLGRELDGLITVGGITETNSAWEGGCRGGVEVLAPAQGIFSATVTGRDHYRGRLPNLRSGTSFAAPIISGIAALLLGEHPDATPRQLEQWIVNTPSRVWNPDQRYADGRVAVLPAADPIRVAARQAWLAP